MITAHTTLNAVLGFPLGHSLSPAFHNAEYTKRAHDAVLLPFENKNLAGLVEAIRTLNIELSAVTSPFKEEIIPFLDEVDPLAQRLQSVNTVLNLEGKLKGFNTDYSGIAAALKGLDLKGKTVLLLGAGGAAHAAAAFVNDQGAELFCLNRNAARAQALVQRFGGTVIDDLTEKSTEQSYDLIINATPVGQAPKSNETPLEARWLSAGQTVFDLVYNPEETRLLREAKAAGAQTLSGLILFKAQALEQIRLWEELVLKS